jgi:hypothetical protein
MRNQQALVKPSYVGEVRYLVTVTSIRAKQSQALLVRFEEFGDLQEHQRGSPHLRLPTLAAHGPRFAEPSFQDLLADPEHDFG